MTKYRITFTIEDNDPVVERLIAVKLAQIMFAASQLLYAAAPSVLTSFDFDPYAEDLQDAS